MKTNLLSKYMKSNYRLERNYSTDNQRASKRHKDKIRRALKKKANREFKEDLSK